MPRIFISYSTKDLEFVQTWLKPLFDELGMPAWCSATDIRMAADWERQIRAALAQADWFVVVLSPDAQTSEWVQAETHWALEHKRGRVIPVMARGCTPEELHLKLGTLQYVDYRQDPAVAAARLRTLIGADPGESATRIFDPRPVPALEGATVIVERLAAEVRLFIEPAVGAGYEQRVLVQRSATIGRMDGVELRLQDDCVSRKHAKLSVARSGSGLTLTLTDLESANGTYVNRERLLTSRCLVVGDIVEIGNARLAVRQIDYRP
jgi:hypothetical protein